jgi:DNA-directed RNA polymerase subunit L
MNSLKLLCTFSRKKQLDETLNEILTKFYDVHKIFVFVNRNNETELYVTFNIDVTKNDIYENYITIHRKKETNTLYSVNALNALIVRLNNGVLDTRYKIDWNYFRNVLLLYKNNDLSTIPISLYEIVEN